MKYICVFCGSATGNRPQYITEAEKLGVEMVKNNIHLIYGGGSIGLMGILADKILALGGEVTGVIPRFLTAKEVDHKGITKLIEVNSMHERKQIMAELADGFIAMPGGFGTLEELAEILTWAQLGLVQKPISLFNVNSYYNPLISLFDTMEESGFLKKENKNLLLIDDDPKRLIEKLRDYKPVPVEKWLHKEQT
ncbi:MAG: TIGR00730 family Rossman fold protein [Bacteroidetes bacterium]|nr:TIGR00730 family Rossman fold protein [Bacteroidota bacterium]